MEEIDGRRLRAGESDVWGWLASLTSALLLHDYGCFVPDLTRFAAEPCERAAEEFNRSRLVPPYLEPEPGISRRE